MENFEYETIIYLNDALERCSVLTSSPRWIRQLKALADEAPEDVAMLQEGKKGGKPWHYLMPQAFVGMFSRSEDRERSRSAALVQTLEPKSYRKKNRKVKKDGE